MSLVPWQEAIAPEAAGPEAFAAKIPAGAVVFGSGVGAYRDVFIGGGRRAGDPEWAVPRASVVARLGGEAYRASGGRDEARTLVPLYLRPTEAEVNAAGKSQLPTPKSQ